MNYGLPLLWKKSARATIPEGNMGYDQFAVPDNAAVESSIINCCFSLALKIYVYGLS